MNAKELAALLYGRQEGSELTSELHNLRYGQGGEYVYQSDSAQEDALALVADIDEILADEKNRVQKASALNQLCKAVGKGTVKIPGSDE